MKDENKVYLRWVVRILYIVFSILFFMFMGWKGLLGIVLGMGIMAFLMLTDNPTIKGIMVYILNGLDGLGRFRKWVGNVKTFLTHYKFGEFKNEK